MDDMRGEAREEQEFSIKIKDILVLLQFGVQAVLRHRLLAAGCFLATLLLAVGAIKAMPRTYEVNTRIMTYSSNVISALTHPGRGVSPNPYAGVRGATEVIKSRERLVGILEEINLIERWKESRTGVIKLKDTVMTALFGEMSEDDLFESIVSFLDQKMLVYTDNDVVVINVTWDNAALAFDIAEAAKRQFLDERRSRELGEYLETVRILEKKLEEAEANIQAVSNELEAEAESSTPQPGVPMRAPTARRRTRLDPDDIERELATVRSEIDRRKANHNQRLNAARNRLSELQTAYGPQHPEIIKTTRYIELLSEQVVVPELFYDKEQQLEGQLARIRKGRKSVGVPGRDISVSRSDEDDDEEEESPAYRATETAYYTVMERLANARLELEAAEAALEFRFKITQPPVFPRRPVKPKPAIIVFGALFLGLFLAVFFCVFADLRSGIILQSWQIKRSLDVPLLGEMDEPHHLPPGKRDHPQE